MRINACLAAALLLPASIDAGINVAVERNRGVRATPAFKFRVLASPSADDIGGRSQLSLAAGSRDPNGGELSVLTDGRVQGGEERRAESFYFDAGTPGGRILLDLGSPQPIDRVNTYSWHAGGRGPQCYVLWASAGTGQGFVAGPEAGTDPEKVGWQRVASVDTRPESGELGGQHAVSIFDADGALGPFRYLLFDISAVDPSDRFGNTFFSEIDVVAGAPPPPGAVASGAASFKTAGGAQDFTIDTSGSPDLERWARESLAPVVAEWYPKIVAMLPSEGFDAPNRFSITISDETGGVAATGGTRITCSGSWFRRNLEGEAKGAVVHELVHVVQRYGRQRRGEGRRSRPPGWLVEGIPDYIRWFLYEPQSRGAEIIRRNLDRARHDASYRISANFLDWVTRQRDKEIVRKLNAALRGGAYDETTQWKEWTGSTVEELAAAWKADLAKAIESGEGAAEKDGPNKPGEAGDAPGKSSAQR